MTTLSSVLLCPFVARARATCSIAFQGLCLKSIRPSKVGDSRTSECTCGQEHGAPHFSRVCGEGAHGYNHSESSVCWATMQWRGEKKKLISIKIWAHFGTVRCRPKWKFVFCTFQISAFTEAYVSSLTLCFCSLDMAKSSEREIVETKLFHDTSSLEEGFGIFVEGLL